MGFGNPATPAWGLGRVCLGTVCGVVPLLLAGVCGVCGWALVSACTPTCVVRDMGRAWLRARSACTPPFLVLVCGVGARAGVWVLAAPRHSLGRCPGVCVVVCPPRVVSCTSWLAVLCGGVWLVPRPATPCWCAGVCVCLCARPACFPPFLAGVCCVGVPAGLRSRLCRALLGWVVGVFFFGGGACHVLALWCRSLAVPVPGLVVSVPPSPLLPAGLLALFFFPSQRGVCPRVLGVPLLGGPLLLAWCCRFWLGGPPVPYSGVLSSVPSGWGVWPPLAVLVGGLVAVGRSLAPPPPRLVFFFGGVCLFLPLPSLRWRTHWSAFSVVLRIAVGGCVLPGRVPAPWVGWVMYTLGSAPLPAGLGGGSAGWTAAPGGFVWLWARWAGVVCVLLASAVPVLTFSVDRHRCCRARDGPLLVCGGLVQRLPGFAVACFG